MKIKKIKKINENIYLVKLGNINLGKIRVSNDIPIATIMFWSNERGITLSEMIRITLKMIMLRIKW